MVKRIDRWVLDQHLEDRRHREGVSHVPTLDKRPSLFRIESVARQEDRLGSARHLNKLVDAGAVRQRRHHEGGVLMGGARHQVAEVVRDHECHLPVRKHRSLRPASRPRREEEPAGVVVVNVCHPRGLSHVPCHQVVVAVSPTSRPNRDGRPYARDGCPGRLGVAGEVGVAQHERGAACFGQVGHLRRRLPEVRRHPHRT